MNTTNPNPALEFTRPVWKKISTALLILIWIAVGIVGAWEVGRRFWLGKELASYNSYVPWGLWVAMYAYLSGISAGAFLIASLAFVFRLDGMQRMGRMALWAALVCLVGALAMIVLDLGHPFRGINVLLSPNLTSMMAWMVLLYSMYFVLLVAALWLAKRDANSATLRLLVAIGIPLAIAFSGGVGALFGVIGAQPGWNTGLYPILFLVSALTTGAALVLLLGVIVLNEGNKEASPGLESLRKVLLGLVALEGLLVWSEMSIGMYASIPHHAEVYRSILFGTYWYNFWLFQVALGLIAPLALLILGKHRRELAALAGLMVMVAFLGVRLNLIIPDLVHPNLAGFEDAYRDQRLRFEYFPSLHEWSVAAGVLALVALLFYAGWRRWPLNLGAHDAARTTGAEPHSPASSPSAPVDAASRRGWLGAACGVMLGAVTGWGLLNTLRKPRFASGGIRKDRIPLPVFPVNDNHDEVLYRMQTELERAMAKPMEERRWGMVIDTRKCIGCHACTIACVAENHLPPGVVYRPVLTEEIGKFPNLAMRFIPRPCMQCEEPPCVPVCPVKATYARPDGIVEINYDECIGCRYCLTACPYNARTSDFGEMFTNGTPEVQPYETAKSHEYGKEWDRAGHDSPVGNARKCHFCLHRLEQGMLPECVTSCVGRATFFGDMNDPESLVAQLSEKPNKMVLLEHLGTKPRVTYLV